MNLSEQAAIASKHAAAAPLSSSLVALLATCSGVSVATIYYAQPLLDMLAAQFAIERAAIGGVITTAQVGCALALFFVVPLGDLVNRKRLLCVQLAALVAALAGVGLATTPLALMAAMLAIGLFGTAMTQGLIAQAAALAGEHERGRVVGAAQGGVVIGVLIARTFAGIVSDLAGWRAVYFASGLVCATMLVALWRLLPDRPAARAPLSYPRLLASMFTLLRDERTLQVRGVLGMLMFTALSVFWSALVLLLGAPPYAMSNTAIGAFGLVGAIGALAASGAGRLADRGYAQRTTGIALLCLIASWGLLAGTGRTLFALIAGVILLDLGCQAIHVVNQSLIFRTRPDAHSRLVGCYMLFYSAGMGLGAIASTATFARAGWSGVCVLGAGVSLLALIFWGSSARLPESPRQRA
ncbi:MFS transporter [Paraburkholderia sp. Se-20369]|nr:MFS transporter [Paraburkholderia sp. Se-20369]